MLSAREAYSQIFSKKDQFLPKLSVFSNAYQEIMEKHYPRMDKRNLYDIFSSWEICISFIF